MRYNFLSSNMKNTLFVFSLLPFISLGQLKFLPKSQGELINHTYYSLSYSEEHEQAEWVHYKLNETMLKGVVPRRDSFKSDKSVSTGSAVLADYKRSGYDRGHLVPAGDMKLSKKSMSETFYLSNIAPQYASFNRGIWKNLESRIRVNAKETELYITTGGVLNSEKRETIGTNNVTVPKQFYKIIYDAKRQLMYAFLMPNKKLNSIEKYAVSVDKIEALTGIDFYSDLVDELENKLESLIRVLPH